MTAIALGLVALLFVREYMHYKEIQSLKSGNTGDAEAQVHTGNIRVANPMRRNIKAHETSIRDRYERW